MDLSGVPPRQLAGPHGRHTPRALSRVRGVSDDRYARVYFDRIERDPKFDGIRNNRALYGSWLLLLQEAEKAWPSPAFPPPTSWVPRRDVELFAARGIVDMTPDGRFQMHGLDSIREERAKRASHAAGVRWGNAQRSASGTADAPARSMPRTEETRQEETSRTRAPEGWPHLDAAAVAALEMRTGQPWSLAGDKQLAELDRLLGDHGIDAVFAALDAVSNGKRMTARQLIWPALRLLEPFPDPKAAKVNDNEKREAAASRRRVEATLRRTHEFGAHADERHPACPVCQEGAA